MNGLIDCIRMKMFGVLNKDGNRIHCTDMFECDKMAVLKWLDHNEIEKLKDNREPADMPSCSYKPQPNKIGKLLWISGIYSNMKFH